MGIYATHFCLICFSGGIIIRVSETAVRRPTFPADASHHRNNRQVLLRLYWNISMWSSWWHTVQGHQLRMWIKEATSMLELTLSKAKINELEPTNCSQEKNQYRIRWGADHVIEHVMHFLLPAEWNHYPARVPHSATYFSSLVSSWSDRYVALTFLAVLGSGYGCARCNLASCDSQNPAQVFF